MRKCRTAQIFEQEFGSDVARIRPIMAADGLHIQSTSNTSFSLSTRRTGQRSQFIYAYGRRRLFYPPAGDNVAGLTLNQDFADI